MAASFRRGRRRTSSRVPGTPSSRASPARACSAASRGPTVPVSTEVVLDDGSSAWSTHEASGRVGIVVYPWEVTLGRDVTDDSSMNHFTGVVTSIVPVGNRARVRVGDLVAEISAVSLDRLDLREGDTIVTSFKATAARLVPLA